MSSILRYMQNIHENEPLLRDTGNLHRGLHPASTPDPKGRRQQVTVDILSDAPTECRCVNAR